MQNMLGINQLWSGNFQPTLQIQQRRNETNKAHVSRDSFTADRWNIS